MKILLQVFQNMPFEGSLICGRFTAHKIAQRSVTAAHCGAGSLALRKRCAGARKAHKGPKPPKTTPSESEAIPSSSCNEI